MVFVKRYFGGEWLVVSRGGISTRPKIIVTTDCCIGRTQAHPYDTF